MTRDEILKMPAGLATNQLVAEVVMGWDASDYTEKTRFKPSTNIASAWKVAEVFPTIGIYHDSVSGEWQVNIRGSVAKAETAPLAICRAALLEVINS